MRRTGHIAHMGHRGVTKRFWRKNVGDRDHLKALGLCG